MATTRGADGHDDLLEHEEADLMEAWTPQRACLYNSLNSGLADVVVGLLILANLVVVIFETDALASSPKNSIPSWITICNHGIMAIFVLELAARIFVYRRKFWHDHYCTLDLAIVVADVTTELLCLMLPAIGHVSGLSILRIFRLGRFARAIRIIKMFPELHLMVSSLVYAMRTTVWGVVLIAFSVTIWSILAVQFLHPYNQQVANSGIYRDAGCTRCEHAWESVWQSVLTIVQTTIAGDSWGQTSLALIERFPSTILFFAGVICTTSLLILNLVLAVIVESASQAAHADREVLALQKEQELQDLNNKLSKSLALLDSDGSGTISLDELLRCFTRRTDVGAHFKSMGLGENDLKSVFELLDPAGNGEIAYKDLVSYLHRMQTQDPLQTTIVLVRQMSQLREDLLKELLTLTRESQVKTLHDMADDSQPGNADCIAELKHNKTESDERTSLRAALQDILEHGAGLQSKIMSLDMAAMTLRLKHNQTPTREGDAFNAGKRSWKVPEKSPMLLDEVCRQQVEQLHGFISEVAGEISHVAFLVGRAASVMEPLSISMHKKVLLFPDTLDTKKLCGKASPHPPETNMTCRSKVFI